MPKLVIPIVIEPLEEGGYLATCELIQGCHAEGETVAEALENLEDVARILLELRREDGLPLPEGLARLGPDTMIKAQLVVTVAEGGIASSPESCDISASSSRHRGQRQSRNLVGPQREAVYRDPEPSRQGHSEEGSNQHSETTRTKGRRPGRSVKTAYAYEQATAWHRLRRSLRFEKRHCYENGPSKTWAEPVP